MGETHTVEPGAGDSERGAWRKGQLLYRLCYGAVAASSGSSGGVTGLSTRLRRAVGRRSWHWVGAAIALAGLVVWEGFQAWPTPAAHWGVGAVIVTGVGLAIAAGAGRQASST
jgi:hypothetical protein